MIQNFKYWTPYSQELCNTCQSTCCYLILEVTLEDLSTMGVITEDEKNLCASDDTFLKLLIKKLTKENIIKRYDKKINKFVLLQKPDLSCQFLDQKLQCTIYSRRPKTCLNFPMIAPFNGRCPYQKKTHCK